MLLTQVKAASDSKKIGAWSSKKVTWVTMSQAAHNQPPVLKTVNGTVWYNGLVRPDMSRFFLPVQIWVLPASPMLSEMCRTEAWHGLVAEAKGARGKTGGQDMVRQGPRHVFESGWEINFKPDSFDSLSTHRHPTKIQIKPYQTHFPRRKSTS